MPLRTLIVDDHAFFRRTLRSFLETLAGVEVVGEANDGAEAVRICKSLQPQAVVMDIHMPQMDGFQAAERIKREHSQTRILLYTGSDLHLISDRLQHSAEELLSKANLFDELPKKLAERQPAR